MEPHGQRCVRTDDHVFGPLLEAHLTPQLQLPSRADRGCLRAKIGQIWENKVKEPTGPVSYCTKLKLQSLLTDSACIATFIINIYHVFYGIKTKT